MREQLVPDTSVEGMSDTEFKLFQKLIHDIAGISLNEGKKVLVISRLSRRLRTLGFSNYSDYYNYLVESPNGEDEITEFINRITTNKTDFFREHHHFEMLCGTVLPALVNEGARNLRIWSAGCSTGEEPYTLAMVVDDWLQKNSRHFLDVKILATDIDTGVLAHAEAGTYRHSALQDIPKEFASRYFTDTGPRGIQAGERIKKYISFKRFNLMHNFPFRHGFDVIFCRNVLIYFNNEDRMSIVRKFHSVLRNPGWLMLGHSESLFAENLGFKNLGSTTYKRMS